MRILREIKRFANDNRIAVVCEGKKMTYKELDNISESFAAYLINTYGESKEPVVIYGNKDNLIIALMMGALKAGRAYVPIDVTFPMDRVGQIIKDVEAKVIINFTDENLGDEKVLSKKDVLSYIDKYKDMEVNQNYWVKDDENVYILFTSGSTGKPKGVQINCNNIDSFTSWFEKYLDLDSNEGVVMNQVSYSFDLSVVPLYMGLIKGKTLYSLSKHTLEDFKLLFEELNKSEISTWISTPTFASICTKYEGFNSKEIPSIDKFCFSGEVLPKELAKELMERFPSARIINGYGPTEGTVFITATDITKDMLMDERGLPVGKPMEGITLKVIDQNGNVLGDGEKGELIAIGKSISKGYFNNDEITKKVFFTEEQDGKLVGGYKTGDLAYFENGIVHYCGRKDFQIKLNGFRIEIEDIENNLRRVDNISNCAVLPVYKDDKIAHLAGFVSLKKENGLSSLKNSIIIKEELKKYIPSYMIPRTIKVINEFPVNTNGKIDRKKLMGEIK